MSRYYVLVLVPRDVDTPEEEACAVAAELLYPHMQDPDKPTRAHKFDYMYGPEDIADLTDDDIADHVWPVSEILEPDTFAGLQAEAIVTPDGAWHEPDDPSQLWDDPAWLEKAHRVLRQHRACLALRHVLHT